jgi:hypothetical protein
LSICRVKHEDAIVDFAHKSIPDSSTLVRPLTEDDVKYTKMKALQDLACSRGVVIGASTMAWDIRDVLYIRRRTNQLHARKRWTMWPIS